MADVKFSGFANGGALASSDTVVGLRSGVNTKFSVSNIVGAPSANIRYASIGGVDGAAATGSYSLPYATPNYASVQVSGATPTNPYAVSVLPGAISETDIHIRPNVSIIGDGYNTTKIICSGYVDLSAEWAAAVGPLFTFNGLNISAQGFVFDAFSASFDKVFRIANCHFTGAWLINNTALIASINSNYVTSLQMGQPGAGLASGWTSTGGDVYSSVTVYNGTFNVDGGFINSLTLDTDSTIGNATSTIKNCVVNSITITGPNTILNIDWKSCQNITVLNGAQLNYLDIIPNGSINYTKLEALYAHNVLCRTSNTDGAPESLGPTGAYQLLGYDGSTLVFNNVDTNWVASGAITYPKIQNIPANSVLCRAGNTSGEVGALTPTAGGQFLGFDGSDLVFHAIDTNAIGDGAISWTKLDGRIRPAATPQYYGVVTTAAGSAVQTFTVTGVDPAVHECNAWVKTLGVVPVVKLASRVSNTNEIEVTFAADPGSDTVIVYEVSRAQPY